MWGEGGGGEGENGGERGILPHIGFAVCVLVQNIGGAYKAEQLEITSSGLRDQNNTVCGRLHGVLLWVCVYVLYAASFGLLTTSVWMVQVIGE